MKWQCESRAGRGELYSERPTFSKVYTVTFARRLQRLHAVIYRDTNDSWLVCFIADEISSHVAGKLSNPQLLSKVEDRGPVYVMKVLQIDVRPGLKDCHVLTCLVKYNTSNKTIDLCTIRSRNHGIFAFSIFEALALDISIQ